MQTGSRTNFHETGDSVCASGFARHSSTFSISLVVGQMNRVTRPVRVRRSRDDDCIACGDLVHRGKQTAGARQSPEKSEIVSIKYNGAEQSSQSLDSIDREHSRRLHTAKLRYFYRQWGVVYRQHPVANLLKIKRYSSGAAADVQDGAAGALNRLPFVDRPLVAFLEIRQGTTEIDKTVVTFDDFIVADAFVAIPDLLPVCVSLRCYRMTGGRLFGTH